MKSSSKPIPMDLKASIESEDRGQQWREQQERIARLIVALERRILSESEDLGPGSSVTRTSAAV